MTPQQYVAQWFAYLELCALEVQRQCEDLARWLRP